MVIPLTLEALILREKKNKRKTMMNNITNTMCRLSTLTQEQIDSLVDVMPDDGFTDFTGDGFIGVNMNGHWGTFAGVNSPSIKTYTEMMQLLGNNMNKQTAQEQMAVMQIEMDKLKAIIDRPEAKPEAKTGRVMSADDLKRGVIYFIAFDSVGGIDSSYFGDDGIDAVRIDAGMAFHDKETAERHLEYLKLEQELRRAQIADGGAGKYKIVFDSSGGLMNSSTDFFHKISFNTHSARKAFRTAHTDEQLILLIRGV
jgi:hypothetical protein